MSVDRHRRAIGEANLFIGANAHCRSVSSGFAFAPPNCNYSFIAVGIHVETIVAGLQNSERLVGRINFIFFVVE